MFTLSRVVLTLLFLLWSLLLLGGSGLIGLVGDGLAHLLSGIGLAWLASAAEGLGKALVLIIWIVSALFFAIFFFAAGQISAILRRTVREQQNEGAGRASGIVTLERDGDGVYR
jgi:hypothetical protein